MNISLFSIGAITNNVAMNIMVQVYWYIQMCISVGYILRKEFLSPKICIPSNLSDNAKLFFKIYYTPLSNI